MLHALPSLRLPFPAAIREVVLHGRQAPSEQYFKQRAVSYLRRQLQCRWISMSPRLPAPEVTISLADWQNRFADARSFDRLLNSVGKEGRFRLVIWTRDWLDGVYTALEVLNRYQRLLPLERAQRLPEVWDASDEAIDVWRWVLRLKPSASTDLQRAALVGDDAALRSAQSSDGLKLLRDAGDISFFSLQSWQYLHTWGLEQTQCVVERRLSRMSDEALCHVLSTRQPPAISRMLETCLEVPAEPGLLAGMS
jgi:hypothetical protein